MSDPRCSLCGDYFPNHTKTCDIVQYRAEIVHLREENEQLQVQLAGCLTAAEGYITAPATKDMYGWSMAYEQTLQLRRRFEALTSRLTEALVVMREHRDAIDGLVVSGPETITAHDRLLHSSQRIVDTLHALEEPPRP